MGPRFELEPLSGALGAEITGFDPDALDDRLFAALESAFVAHKVLVMRGAVLPPDRYLRLARRFGAPSAYPFATGLPDHPEIVPIVKDAHQTSNFGGMWHADTTYTPQPPKATMLMAVETPPTGGDTLFACAERAYAALSPAMQTFLSRLTGISSSAKNAAALRGSHLASGSMTAAQAMHKTAEHPAVRVHPVTGRRALYVNPAHTVGFAELSDAEAAPIRAMLFAHMTRPEFTVRVRWSPGTITIWDNRSSQHCAINDYDGHRREMWRITLEGETPVGP